MSPPCARSPRVRWDGWFVRLRASPSRVPCTLSAGAFKQSTCCSGLTAVHVILCCPDVPLGASCPPSVIVLSRAQLSARAVRQNRSSFTRGLASNLVRPRATRVRVAVAIALSVLMAGQVSTPRSRHRSHMAGRLARWLVAVLEQHRARFSRQFELAFPVLALRSGLRTRPRL